MSVAGAIMAGVGEAGSLGSSAIEANAAGNAASTQATAAEKAGQLQAEMGQEALGYQNYQYQQDAANQQPWLQGGANSLSSLEYLLGLQNSATGATGPNGAPGTGPQSLSIPGVSGTVNVPGVTGLTAAPDKSLGAFGSLMSQYPGGKFQAPTEAQAAATPGYQFALHQGEGAVQAGASANGSLLTGGTLNAEQQFGQGLANTNYNNVYNQALQTYGTNYNTWANTQATQYNRLAALAGMGQTTAQQLGTAGIQSAHDIGNTLTNTGQLVGQQYNNAAAATASGYMGAANAWGSGISSAASQFSQMAMLNQLMQNQNQGGPYGPAGMYQLNDMTQGMNSPDFMNALMPQGSNSTGFASSLGL